MSVDVTFWKPTEALEASAVSVYTRLCRRQAVEGLEKLPIKEILSKIKKQFPSFNPKEEPPEIECDDGGAEVGWSDYHMRFDHAAGVVEPMPSIRKLLSSYGCSMYLSSVDRLYGPKEPSHYDESPEQKKAAKQIDKAADRANAAFKELIAAIGNPRDAMKAMSEITRRVTESSSGGGEKYFEALQAEIKKEIAARRKS